MASFCYAKETTARVEVVGYGASGRDYFDLVVSTEGGRRYYMRQPTRTQLDDYAKRIPLHDEVDIHYLKDSSGFRIYDIRNADSVMIPVGDCLREVRTKRALVYGGAGAFALLGAVGLCWEKRTRSGKTSKA